TSAKNPSGDGLLIAWTISLQTSGFVKSVLNREVDSLTLPSCRRDEANMTLSAAVSGFGFRFAVQCACTSIPRPRELRHYIPDCRRVGPPVPHLGMSAALLLRPAVAPPPGVRPRSGDDYFRRLEPFHGMGGGSWESRSSPTSSCFGLDDLRGQRTKGEGAAA